MYVLSCDSPRAGAGNHRGQEERFRGPGSSVLLRWQDNLRLNHPECVTNVHLWHAFNLLDPTHLIGLELYYGRPAQGVLLTSITVP